MADPYIDIPSLQASLATFFDEKKADLSRFGSTVNQTFEAYVFASTVDWYKSKGWTVKFVHPFDDKGNVRTHCHLRFSTNGKPSGYSYALCKKGKTKLQVRHQLRVATKHYKVDNRYPANICLDIAVIKDTELCEYTTKTHLPNDHLITFGEAKHMSAFAELVAGFLGLVHELQPHRLNEHRTNNGKHLKPFLYVSGWLNGTALGIHETIKQRKFDVQVFSIDNKMSDVAIHVTKKKRRPAAAAS